MDSSATNAVRGALTSLLGAGDMSRLGRAAAAVGMTADKYAARAVRRAIRESEREMAEEGTRVDALPSFVVRYREGGRL